MSDTEKIIDLLVEKTNHSREEILQKIQKTLEDRAGLINEEGAAMIVASDMKIPLIEVQNTTLKIEQISLDDSNITLKGRVKRIYPTNTFTRKDNNQGKVKNISLVDDTGEIRVALWDSMVDEFDEKSIKIGDPIQISGLNAKSGYQDRKELSIGRQSTLKLLEETDASNLPELEKAPMKTIEEIANISDKDDVSIKGKITFKRDSPSEFSRNDGTTGKVSSIRIQDMTGQIRISFWDNDTTKLDELQVNDTIQLNNVNVGTSSYGKELTFRTYSTVKKISDPVLQQLETAQPSRDSVEILEFENIEDNTKGLNLTGKVIGIGTKNSFDRNGETNYVGNITITDKKNYQKRVSLWGDQANLVDSLSIGDIVKITNASAKYNDYSKAVELSLNDYSTLKVITDDINPDEFKIEITYLHFNDLTEPRSNAAIKLRIKKMWDPRTITRDDGSESTVLNVPVLDENGTEGRIAAWNDDIDKIQDLEENGDYNFENVRLKPAGQYPAEVTISAMTGISSTTLDIDTTFQSAADMQYSNYSRTSLINSSPGSNIEVQGTIVSIFAPSYYEACNLCGRSVNNDNPECNEHGDMTTLKMIITARLDDNSDVMDLKIFDDAASELLSMTAKDAQEQSERLGDEKAPVNDLMLKDFVVQGRIVETTYQDIPKKELHVRKIYPVNPEQEVDDFLNQLDNSE